MRDTTLDDIIEAALLAAGEPLPVERLETLFLADECPSRKALREALSRLALRHDHGPRAVPTVGDQPRRVVLAVRRRQGASTPNFVDRGPGPESPSGADGRCYGNRRSERVS